MIRPFRCSEVRPFEPVQKLNLQPVAEKILTELQGPSRVLDDLNSSIGQFLSKNQPQLVNISIAWRCISRSLIASIRSVASILPRCCLSRNS